MSEQEIIIWLKQKYIKLHHNKDISDYIYGQIDLIDELLAQVKNSSIGQYSGT